MTNDDDEKPLLERVNIARQLYLNRTGRLPTRCVLTSSDALELTMWMFHNDESAIIGPPATNELELYGMRLRIAPYAKTLRVYFQES